MNDQVWLAERFEGDRTHLRGVAFRMLGSLTEVDDRSRKPGSVDGVDTDDPVEEAEGRRVFELHPIR